MCRKASDIDERDGMGCRGSQSGRKCRPSTGTYYSEILSSNVDFGGCRTWTVSATALSTPDLYSSRRVGILERATGMGVRICDTMLRLWGVAGWQQVAEGAKRGKRDGRLPGMGVTEGEGSRHRPGRWPGRRMPAGVWDPCVRRGECIWSLLYLFANNSLILFPPPPVPLTNG